MRIITLATIYCIMSIGTSATIAVIKNDKMIFERSLCRMWHTMIFATALALMS